MKFVSSSYSPCSRTTLRVVVAFTTTPLENFEVNEEKNSKRTIIKRRESENRMRRWHTDAKIEND